MGLVQDAFTAGAARQAPGHDRDRPRPLLDGRRLAPEERAALRGRLRARLARRRAQRQPHQRRRAPRRARGEGLDLPVDGRHRGASSTWWRVSTRSRSRIASSTRSRRCGARTRSSSSPRTAIDRGARSDGHSSALPRHTAGEQGRARRRQRADARSTSSAPSTCATSSPGEMVVIDERRHPSAPPPAGAEQRMCVFEYVYFARPDSTLGGRSVYEVRKELGEQLAQEHADRGRRRHPRARLGRARARSATRSERGIPFEMGLIRSHYVGRTFIEPQQSIRHFGVRLKLNPVETSLRASASSSSTTRSCAARRRAKIVKMLRDAGAREVHLRISSPPTSGLATTASTRRRARELIASSHSNREIARYVTATRSGTCRSRGCCGR